jgi:hypothetical protein
MTYTIAYGAICKELHLLAINLLLCVPACHLECSTVKTAAPGKFADRSMLISRRPVDKPLYHRWEGFRVVSGGALHETSLWIRLFNGTGLPRSTSAGRPTLPGPDSELLARGKCLILSSQHGPSVSRAWRFSVHAGGYFCILIRIEARMMGLSESRRPVSNAFTRGATERLSRLTRFSSAASEQRGASICRGAGRSRAPRIAASAPKGRHCFRNNK